MTQLSLKPLPDRTPDVYILLVEDDPADQLLVVEYLREIDGQSFDIDTVGSLKEARAALTEQPVAYDAVLLDHCLIDGYSIDLIRELSQDISAPMIILTGMDSREVDASAMEAGASDFVAKDNLNPLILERTIRHSIERHSTALELRQNYDDLKHTNDRLKEATAQLEAESANIVKLTEHLAKAPNSGSVSFLVREDAASNHETVAQGCRIGAWHISERGFTISMNASMRAMLGLDDDAEVEGQSFWHLLCTFDRGPGRRELLIWAKGTISSFEAESNSKYSGHRTRMVLSGSPIKNHKGEVESVMISAVDITDRRNAEAMIQDIAQRDPLTGLLNRLVFREMLASAMSNNDRNGSQLAVLYVDLDAFKEINDTKGHQAGDILLKHTAERLKENTRESDFAARLGGDEFIVVLNNLHAPTGAAKVAETMLASLRDPCVIDGETYSIEASIGIAVYPDDSRDPDQLVKNADLALYQCKEAGGNSFQFFDASMRDDVEQRRQCQTDLVRAIDSNEFKIAYQPQISLADENIVGCEALIRWDRPEYGWMPPIDFLPIAEDTGLIIPIGDWVLAKACREIAGRAKTSQTDFRLSVNLSARQLKQPHLAERISEILEETGYPPDKLELEITETAIIDDVGASARIVDTLRALGIRISLDDFGTGYSSLAVLSRFSIDSLKIDKSFVDKIGHSATNAAIVKSTIALGASLGFSVVAEGIETREQLEILKQMDCHKAQGYYICKPVFVDALECFTEIYDADRRRVS